MPLSTSLVRTTGKRLTVAQDLLAKPTSLLLDDSNTELTHPVGVRRPDLTGITGPT